MNGDTLTIPGAFGISVLGFAIVFFVLIVLMAVINILRSVVGGMNAKAAAAAKPAPAAAVAAVAAKPAPAPAPAPVPAAGMVPAKGSLGEVKLYDVDDGTAAMIMAIVADELKAPLNELRFLAIREKK